MSDDAPLLPARGPGRPAGARSGATREALIEAAHEVMAERGYPRVTLREVADRAGVQPGLVSYYFGGKEGLLRAVIERVSEQMRARLHAAAGGGRSDEATFRSLIRAVVGAIREAPYGPRLMIEQVLFADEAVLDEYVAAFARPNLADVEALLRDGAESGDLRPVDARFLMPMMFGACVFFFLGSSFHGRLFGYAEVDEAMARDFADFVADVLLHGIAAPQGSKA
jgi:AcrR family transcriptional regulator